jgi:hypothetical protein
MIRMDATAATRLAVEVARNRALLLPEVKAITSATGLRIRTTARQLAKSERMPGLSRSIWTKTRHTVAGTEVTVEAASPFGYIREFGAGRSGPMPFMYPAYQAHVPAWQAALEASAAKVL